MIEAREAEVEELFTESDRQGLARLRRENVELRMERDVLKRSPARQVTEATDR